MSPQPPGPDWFFKPAEATSASTSPVQILRTSAQQGSKHPTNAHGQERQKCRREAWVAKRKAAKAAAVPAASAAAPASQQALQQQQYNVLTCLAAAVLAAACAEV